MSNCRLIIRPIAYSRHQLSVSNLPLSGFRSPKTLAASGTARRGSLALKPPRGAVRQNGDPPNLILFVFCRTAESCPFAAMPEGERE